MTPAIQLSGVTKSFGHLTAVKSVDFTLEKSQIHSIVGGNGAGKSTLVKIMYGVLHPDAGNIHVNGKNVDFTHPLFAIQHKIGMVPQEMLLMSDQTALNNIILGTEITNFGVIDYEASKEAISKIIDKNNIALDLERVVGEMTVGEKQRVLILRLLYNEAEIIILDEPTAALTPQEVTKLFTILKTLKEAGASIIFISHKLPEVLEISDQISVMRSGEMLASLPAKDTSREALAELMTGEKLSLLTGEKKASKTSETAVFELRNLSCTWGNSPLKNISLKISTGEIYGILGIEGNGQKELEEIVSGQNKNFEGEILVNNVPLIFKDGFNLKDSGIGYIPSHREEIGIIEKFSLEQNLMLGHQHNKAFRENLFFDKTGIKTFTEHVINSYDISPADPEAPLSTFSGGNQQKVVLGREELENLIVLFACNPTRGIDIKAIHYLNEKLFALRKEGAAIFMIISDIEEALHTCDRIAVIYSGKIIKEFHPEETNAQELGYYMLGGKNKQN